MNKHDYEAVCDNMHLSSNILWPIPIILDVNNDTAKRLSIGNCVCLRDDEGFMTAALHIEDIWEPDRNKEVKAVYGTTSTDHPGTDLHT